MRDEDRYDSLLRWAYGKAAAEYGFAQDPSADWRLLKAQVARESSFRPKVVQPESGAIGLLQLLPSTAEEAGVSDPFDPEQNLLGGARYLGRMWSVWKAEHGWDRWAFALGSYNAGLGHILEAQALAETRQFPTDRWASIAQLLPEVTGEHARETTDYVRKITADFHAMRQLDREALSP